MADFVQLQKIVKTIEDHPKVQDATIVSRSGMHVAGDIPRGIHMETYVAMSAILLGAAESATSELHDQLRYIVVQLHEAQLILTPAGRRALLVMRATADANAEELSALVRSFAEKIDASV